MNNITMMNRLYMMCLCALLAASCTNDNDALPSAGGQELSDTPILLSAGVGPGGIEAETRAVAGGAIGGEASQTLSFALANDNNATGSAAYGAYGATFTASRAEGSSAATALTNFSTAQYYLANGRTSKITGWFPAGSYTSGASAKVSWTLTGQEDVMVAPAQSGSKSSAMPALAFQHKLAQVQVYAYATDAAAKAVWGDITSVSLTGQKNACSYTLSADATGAVVFETLTTSLFAVGSGRRAPGVGSGSAVLLGKVMMEPKTAALNLSVTTVLGGQKTVTVTSREYLASNAYKITLKLDKSVISPSASISSWVTSSSTDKEVVL